MDMNDSKRPASPPGPIQEIRLDQATPVCPWCGSADVRNDGERGEEPHRYRYCECRVCVDVDTDQYRRFKVRVFRPGWDDADESEGNAS